MIWTYEGTRSMLSFVWNGQEKASIVVREREKQEEEEEARYRSTGNNYYYSTGKQNTHPQRIQTIYKKNFEMVDRFMWMYKYPSPALRGWTWVQRLLAQPLDF